MGLFGLFRTKTKADYDVEIEKVKGEIARLKLQIKVDKEFNREKGKSMGVHRILSTSELAHAQQRLATLKAERVKAPKK